MRPEDFREFLRREPFIPFRIILTNGTTYDIFHPENAMLSRSVVHVGLALPGESHPIFDRVVTVALVHIVQIELLEPVTS